jgi:lipopolysaccharide export system permease protein
VDKISARDEVVNNVFVQSSQANRLGVMVAQKGFVETAANGDRFVVLLNGRRYEGTPGTLDYRTADFDRYMLRIEPREAKKDETPPAKALGTLELLDAPTPHNLAELHWRIALPFSVLLMAMFAVPLSFVNPRTGRSWNLFFAVLAYALYNNLLSIFQAWTAQGKIPTWLGLWPVHLAVIAILAFLLSRQMFSRRWFMPGR